MQHPEGNAEGQLELDGMQIDIFGHLSLTYQVFCKEAIQG